MSAGERVIDPGASARRSLLIGAVLFGVVGLVLVIAAFAEETLAAGILGLVFLLVAALFGYGGRRYAGGPRFVVNPNGISCGDITQGAEWTVAWSQLRVARTNYAAGTPCLELIPLDPEIAVEHTNLEQWWIVEENLWRFPLTSAGNGMRKLAHAIRTFRPR